MPDVVGPGAVQPIESDVRPLLEGASEFEYVTILNPLPVDFAVRVAQDVPVNMPIEIRGKTAHTKDDGDLRRSYGLDLKNPDFQSRRHITNDTIIKSGQTINLKGNEAQVALKQLVSEIAQREKKGRLLADPVVRREIEERIVIARGSVQDLLDGGLRTQRQQIDEALDKSNQEEVPNESFPDLQVNEEPKQPDQEQPEAPKKPGRPKKQ